LDNIKIVALVPYKIYPSIFGGQKCIASRYEYLNEIVPVCIISIKGNETFNVKPRLFRILSNSKFRYVNPFNVYKIYKLLKKENATHLSIEHPYMFWVGYVLKKLCKIKIVIFSHNIEGIRFKTLKKWWWPILLKYEGWAHRNADINFFITDDDMQFALQHFNLQKNKYFVSTYGVSLSSLPSRAEKEIAKNKICLENNISPSNKLLLFNGSLDYEPNIFAIENIINHINPILITKKLEYKIIICGKNLPDKFYNFKNEANIIYAGFVKDIKSYFLGSDVFINPVKEGGGIKTKLVEALGYNLSAVSFKSGGIGIPAGVANEKLIITDDDNFQDFSQKILDIDTTINLKSSFYENFYWGNIANKIVDNLNN
jgi:polysaccharide biosynthesis protein PslH